jgi:glycerate kinase
MRTILIAPTAFKGTLSPIQVASAIEDGAREALGDPLDVISVPIADGGDGTVECVARIIKDGELRDEQCLGALSQPIQYQWFKHGTTALVELAACCGIAQLQRAGTPLDAMRAHTYGLGQAIARCYEAGCEEINIAVGGSASTDGGMGALKALGAMFFDELGEEVTDLGGEALRTIVDADLTELRYLTKSTKLRVLTDVLNPLIGENGAAKIFGPQKGASAADVEQLEAALAHWAIVLQHAAENELPVTTPGTGAAGGTAFGLAVGLNAEITSGFEWLARAAQLDERIAQADLIITGEGRFDAQSLHGKAVGQIVDLCRAANKKVLVVSGCDSHDLPADAPQVIVPTPTSGAFCSRRDLENAVAKTLPNLPHLFHN